MKREVFDERQQIERGKAFRNAFVIAILVLFACTLADKFSSIPFTVDNVLIAVCFGSFSAFLITVILGDAIIGINTKTSWKAFSVIFIIAGIALAVAGYFDYIGFLTEEPPCNPDELITDCFGSLAMVTAGVVYQIKQHKLRTLTEEE